MDSSKVVLKVSISDGVGNLLIHAGKPYNVLTSDNNSICIESEFDGVAVMLCEDDGGIKNAIEEYIVEPLMLN